MRFRVYLSGWPCCIELAQQAQTGWSDSYFSATVRRIAGRWNTPSVADTSRNALTGVLAAKAGNRLVERRDSKVQIFSAIDAIGPEEMEWVGVEEQTGSREKHSASESFGPNVPSLSTSLMKLKSKQPLALIVFAYPFLLGFFCVCVFFNRHISTAIVPVFATPWVGQPLATKERR